MHMPHGRADRPDPRDDDVAVVVIGRNEGERLLRCLSSLPRSSRLVYVDSGSTDDSVAAARAMGVEVVELDMAHPFTAARARNAGIGAIEARGTGAAPAPCPAFVQMIDGDCTLDPGWIAAGRAAMDREPRLAAVFGRRRERHPDASLHNAMCDEEWDVPVGPVRACGGDALFRFDALREAGGYDPTLIAGEEPDLCWRMGRRGWTIRRIDAEMTRHDAAMDRLSQARRRAMRAGHAFAELVWRHGDRADPAWRRAIASTLLWGLALPAVALAGLALVLLHPWWAAVPLAIAALYVVQWMRIAAAKRRGGHPPGYARGAAAVLMLTKVSQAHGMLRFALRRLLNRQARIIEYK